MAIRHLLRLRSRNRLVLDLWSTEMTQSIILRAANTPQRVFQSSTTIATVTRRARRIVEDRTQSRHGRKTARELRIAPRERRQLCPRETRHRRIEYVGIGCRRREQLVAAGRG